MANGSNIVVYSSDSFISGINDTDTKYIDNLFDLLCTQLAVNTTEPPLNCIDGGAIPSPTSAVQYTDPFFATLGVSKCSKIILTVLFGLVLIAALLGNVTVLVTVMCNRIMWTTMHIFIVSLAVSDVLVSITCIPLNIGQVLATEWPFGSLTCQLMPFFMQMSISASILTLCCMAAERYVAIVHPLKLNLLQSTERVWLLLVAVWLVAVAAAAPYAYFYDTRDLCGRQLPSGQCLDKETHTLCSVREGSLFAAAHLHWLTFLILFVMPAFVLGVTYGIIIYKLWVKAPVGAVMISAVAMRTRYKRKAIKMLLLVVVLFLTCWAPLLTFDLATMTNHDIHVSSSLMNLRYFLQCLAFSSTAYNPIVYAFMNKKFRTNFQALLLRNRARVAPLTVERENNQIDPDVNGLKTGSTNGGTTKRSISPMQTKSSKL